MATPMDVGVFFRKLCYSQLFIRIPPPESDFSGQTIIVTGSNTGLGFEAACHLLQLKASKVILAVRDSGKGEAAAERLLASTGATKNNIEVWPLDLANQESVKRFAGRVNELDRLDAVISNAGMLTQKWKIVEGLEAQIAVNVVNTTLLGLLLLPKLRSSAQKHHARGRMAFVSSEAHYIAQVYEASSPGSLFDALNKQDVACMEDRYSTSKLLQLYAIREIAARTRVTPDSDVIINAMTPGMCYSELFRDDQSWLKTIGQRIMLLLLARSTATGGATLVHAIAPDIPLETHGAFLMDCKVAENGPNVESETGKVLQQRFVTELFQRLETISPGVTNVLN